MIMGLILLLFQALMLFKPPNTNADKTQGVEVLTSLESTNTIYNRGNFNINYVPNAANPDYDTDEFGHSHSHLSKYPVDYGTYANFPTTNSTNDGEFQRTRSIRSAELSEKSGKVSAASKGSYPKEQDTLTSAEQRRSRSNDFVRRYSGVQHHYQAIQCSAITCYNGGECSKNGEECVCPMGVSGKHCEIEMQVKFPRFFGKGYIEFPVLLEAETNFVIKMDFKPEGENGLLLFTSDFPNAMFDYFSLSILSSKIDFRLLSITEWSGSSFDCGSGVAIMRSEQKVRLGEWNQVVISRQQKHAFVQLNGGKKTTGKSKGHFTRINFLKHLYLGGYHSMEEVKDRTGMEAGFQGCVRMLKVNDKVYDMRKEAFVGDALAGYNVEECGWEVCKKVECLNGGHCITEDAQVPLCVCPLGSDGSRCEHKIFLSVPMFTGFSSFLQYTGLQRSVLSYSEIEVTFKPISPDGLLIYNGYAKDKTGDFLSLAMRDGFIEHRFDLGSGPAVMRSRNRLKLDEWHMVRLSRTGRNGILKVDEDRIVEAMATGAFTQLTLTLDLFIGGHRNFDEVASQAGVNKSFEGCIQKIVVNELPMKMLDEAITGLNVKNCDHACVSKPCSSVGRCLPEMHSFKCSCPLVATGPRCAQKLDFTSIKIPSFNRNSFLFYTGSEILNKISGRETKVNIRVLTSVREGLILWACEEELGPHGDFFSVGVHEGYLQVGYNLGSGDVRGILNSSRIDDGQWHSLKIHRHDRKCYGAVDGEAMQLVLESPGDMKQLTNLATLYIGGMDEISLGTQQHYKEGLKGCLSHVSLNDDYEVDVVKAAVDGANIKHCII